MDGIDHTAAPLLGADAADAIPGQYIVMLREGTTAAILGAAMNRVALLHDDSRVERAYSIVPGFAARLSPEALAVLRRDPSVEYIEADRIVTAQTVHASPSDGIDRTDQCTGANGLYDDRGLTGSGVHVYIVDTGIRTTHTEFTGRVGNGASSVSDGRGVEDCQGHGTHVASLAVGTQFGMAKQAIVHPVRVLSCTGSGSTSGVIAGVDFVRTDCPKQGGRCVGNMSLGGAASTAMDTAVSNAVAAGIPFTVAAGGSNANACNTSPARVPAAITVGASDDTGCKASSSSFGPCVDIFAPGATILGASAASNTATQTLSGSSMSAGLTAGAVALFLQAQPTATPAQADAAMKSAATPMCCSNLGAGSPALRLFNDFRQPTACPSCSLQ